MAYMSEERLHALFQGIGKARVALIGDLCLDVYWMADMRLSELSRETPHYPLPVVEERYSPGGAGNVASNVAALQPACFTVLGAVGQDWRGDMLIKCLKEQGVETSFLVQSEDVVTNTYIKPLRKGISHVVYEDPRLDFENRKPMSAAVEASILDALRRAEDRFEVLLVSDQMKFGCVTAKIREEISRLGQSGKTVIVDSRDRAGLYHHVIVKPNEVEASRAFGDGSVLEIEDLKKLLPYVSEATGAPAIITVGDQGCLVWEDGQAIHVPARHVPPPIDIVGAGDTFLSALGCAVAGGAKLAEAARFACLASSVTIAKVGTTGTASREELQEKVCL